MAVYRLEDIVKDVKIALDRNGDSDALRDIRDLDTLTLDEIIESKVVEAVKIVHGTAPAHLLDGGNSFAYSFADAIYWQDKECGWVLLPEDFMRFVSFKMDDWDRAVFTCMSTDDAEYEKQSSPFKGIRGNARNPKCFISVRPEGRVLEFYSCKTSNAKITQAIYLPYPKIDELNSIEICSRCYNAVIYTIAALVAATYDNIDKNNVFNELAKQTLV